MTATATDVTTSIAPRRVTRTAGITLGIVALVVVALLSLAIGAKPIPLSTVIDSLLHPSDTQDSVIITDLRVPRTILGLLVGAALGLAGALMQALTRNPLADPGLLGVNAGAAAAVIVAIALLALAGTAITAALTAFTYAVALSDPDMLQRFNQWNVGSLAGRDTSTIRSVAPFLLVGIALALLLPRALNALALGEDTARALGANVGRTRIAGAVAITLMCGAATAAAGPIVFVGLTIPHIARALVGPDQRWVLPCSALLGPVLLVGADVTALVLRSRRGGVSVRVPMRPVLVGAGLA